MFINRDANLRRVILGVDRRTRARLLNRLLTPLASWKKSARTCGLIMNSHGQVAGQFVIAAQRGAPGYREEEPPAFCPRTHASKIFQSGSSWDLNCRPPWWVSAMPPASGASGISSNRLEIGLPGVTNFETT